MPLAQRFQSLDALIISTDRHHRSPLASSYLQCMFDAVPCQTPLGVTYTRGGISDGRCDGNIVVVVVSEDSGDVQPSKLRLSEGNDVKQ